MRLVTAATRIARWLIGSAVVPLLLIGLSGPAVAGGAAGSPTIHPVGHRCSVADLGNLGDGVSGPSSSAAVSDAGYLVGTSRAVPGFDRAFLWSPVTRTMRDLGTLGGPSAGADDINNRGVVVGWAEVAGGDTHAFRWDPVSRRMTDLGTLGGTTSRAHAISDRGVIVGESTTSSGALHAFRWDPSSRRMKDLGTLGGETSQAYGVNDSGEIVGDSSNADGLTHAFRWSPRTGSMRDLGVLPGTVVSFARDINDHGQIVGWSADVSDDSNRAFSWSPVTRTMRPLAGTGSSEAHGVNSRGQVVGSRATGTGPEALLWNGYSRPVVLPALSGPAAAAFDINLWTRIAGTSDSPVHQFAAVRWTCR